MRMWHIKARWHLALAKVYIKNESKWRYHVTKAAKIIQEHINNQIERLT